MNIRYVSCYLISQLCLAMGAVLAAEPVVWDFASGDGAWQPRSKTIAAEHATAMGPNGKASDSRDAGQTHLDDVRGSG